MQHVKIKYGSIEKLESACCMLQHS